MKAISKFLLAGLFLTAGLGMQNEVQAQEGPIITFEEEVYDFGKINQHDDAVHVFNYTNTGDEPLIISSAKGSCSCTVPKWSREPLAPGESGSITVKYDSKRVGPINKSVTLTSNSAVPTKVLRIKGQVAEVAKPGLPAREASPVAPAVAGSN